MAVLTASGVNFSDGSTINGTTAGVIGCYIAGFINTGGSFATYGSNYANVLTWSQPFGTATTRSGTWRALGTITNVPYGCGSVANPALFVRVA